MASKYSQVTSFVLLTVALVSVKGLPECATNINPHMISYGEDSRDTSDPSYHIPYEFVAFGARHPEGWTINPLTDKAAGSFLVHPVPSQRLPGTFEVRASRMSYQTTPNSFIGGRVTNRTIPLNHIARIINEAYPCFANGAYNPIVAFIYSYQCVRFRDHDDTFQTIITTDGSTSFLILIYSAIDGKIKSQFGIRDFLEKKTYKLTLGEKDDVDILLSETNGLRPGVWVYDITGREPERPKECEKSFHECTATENGDVNSFDDQHRNFNLDGNQRISVLMATTLPWGSACNIGIYALKRKRGVMKGIQVKIPVGDENSFFRNLFFNKREGVFHVRADDVKRKLIPSLPYTYQDKDTTMTVKATDVGGFLLTSPTCGYSVEFQPQGLEPRVKVTLDKSYVDQVAGLCANYVG